MGRADVYSQPDAPDPVLPTELVREIAEPHLPSDLRLSDGMVVEESGGEARVYLFDRADVGGGVAVKTQRPHRLRPRTSLAKEAALLAALAGPLVGRIPVVYGYDQVETAVGPVELIVMSRVPGRPVNRTTITRPIRSELLRQLAGVLRAVHSLDPAELVKSNLLPADEGVPGLRSRLEPNFADLAEKLEGRRDSWPLTVSPSRVAALALDALPSDPAHPATVLHSNPGITHTFADPAGVFSGLIDFGDAYASHPALDLRSWPDPDDRVELRRHYLDGHTASADWDAVWTAAMIYADMAALTGPACARRTGSRRPFRAAPGPMSRGADVISGAEPVSAGLGRAMRPYARQVAGLLTVGSLCGILMNTAVVLPAVLLGHAIDTVLAFDRGETDDAAVTRAVLLLVAGTLATELPRIGKRYWLGVAQEPHPGRRAGRRTGWGARLAGGSAAPDSRR